MVWLGLLVRNAEDESNPHFISWVLLDCQWWTKFLDKSFIPLRIPFISCCCFLPVSPLGYQKEDWHMWFVATSASVPLSVLWFQQRGASGLGGSNTILRLMKWHPSLPKQASLLIVVLVLSHAHISGHTASVLILIFLLKIMQISVEISFFHFLLTVLQQLQ